MRKILGVVFAAGGLTGAAWAGGHDGVAATITHIGIDGVSLKAELEWVAGPAFSEAAMVLRDELGEVVASTPVAPQRQGQVVGLEGAFVGFSERGLQYFLAVEENGGAVAKPFPFHLTLECPEDDNCSLRPVSGLHNQGTVVTEEALDAGFDAFSGSEDILADLLKRFPEQRGAAYSFSWQLNRRFPRGAPCSCIWLAVPVTQVGADGSVGAAHRIGVLPNAGDVLELETSGESRLNLRLRCFRVADNELMDIGIEQTGEGLLLYQPQLKTCPAPCSGSVVQSLSYEADYLAESGAGSSSSAQGAVAYEVEGVSYINAEAQAAAGGPAGVPSQLTELNAIYSQSGDQPQLAVLQSTAQVSAIAGASGEAIGYAESTYQMIAEGISTCAVQSYVAVTLQHLWPPLDIRTTNITLIIGN